MLRKFCYNCKEPKLHTANDTSHVMHLLLTLLTGFWAIIWIFCYMSNESSANVCTQCGCKNG